ncbi:hypothetical protein OC835_004272 [Tilletia horrida]|uniref:Peptidase S8/S53 domain-containing protein n=1 Tax=Tilletia horrida TaxID=155126 RepID=A0AAN6GEW6_9BASI|nr:hypothetical protein OC835_004272 [Tilletia horrida]KAK0533200.1 hypothetical protein OC842_003041 [Tilletia horrida]
MQSWPKVVPLLYALLIYCLAGVRSADGTEWRSNTLSGTLSRSFILELDPQIVTLEDFRKFDVKNRKINADTSGASLAGQNTSVDYMPWGRPAGPQLPAQGQGQQQRQEMLNNSTISSRQLSPFHAGRGPWSHAFRQARERRDADSPQYIGPIYFAIRQEFPNKRLFFGISVTLEHAYDMSLLRHMRGVRSVTPISFIRRPMPYGNKVQLASKPSQHQLLECKNNLAMTGVDKLHAMGIDGRSTKVAIIDTGVDWSHPALGGCFGKGCKVSFGFDFVGDDYDGANDPAPDADPLSSCGPHGTHVTGIIGAQDSKYRLTGVAPGAQLGMYRVFGCQGGTADDLLMKAMEAAFEDGADILSISVGAPAGWTETPTARMASNVAKEGRIVVVASGNDGAVGMFFPSSPAVGKDVIAVGSIDSALFTVFNATPYYAPRAFKLPAMPVYATASDPSVSRDACDPLPEYVPDLSPYVVLVRRGGCSLDVKFRHVSESGGKTVLLWNTALPPIYLEPGNGVNNAAMIAAADGAWILDQIQSGNVVRLAFPDNGPTTVANNMTGGTVSPFSSYGPTFDLLPPTDVSAPGGLILSTWPVNLGNYSILSGTSMAAPFTAGAAALVLQAQRQGRLGTSVPVGPRDIIDRLRNTALPASNSTKGIFLETVAKQGSGLLQVDKAVMYTTVISPSRIMLNDTRTFKRMHTFNITNGSPQVLSYLIEHEAAGSAITFPFQRYNYQNMGPVPMVSSAASVVISPRQLSLDPGETYTVTVNFTLPQGRDVDPGLFPVFSGFLRVSSSGNETLTVAYMGLGADLSSIKMLDDKNGMSKNYALPAVLIGDTGKVQRLPRVYTFQDGDLPVLQFRLVAGSRLTRIDIVENVAQVRPDDVPFLGPLADQDLPAANAPEAGTPTDAPVPVPSDPNDVLAPFTRRARRLPLAPHTVATGLPHLRSAGLGRLIPPGRRSTASENLRNFNASRIVGPITSAALLPRNSMDQSYGIYAVIWDGTVGGIGRVQPGDYKILLRTLRIGAQAQDDDMQSEGDAQEQDTTESGEKRWEEWLSPVIRVPKQ